MGTGKLVGARTKIHSLFYSFTSDPETDSVFYVTHDGKAYVVQLSGTEYIETKVFSPSSSDPIFSSLSYKYDRKMVFLFMFNEMYIFSIQDNGPTIMKTVTNLPPYISLSSMHYISSLCSDGSVFHFFTCSHKILFDLSNLLKVLVNVQ